jgi:hypothetical protein
MPLRRGCVSCDESHDLSLSALLLFDLPEDRGMLKFKPKWVKPDFGKGDVKFQLYPKLSIEDWHRKHGLWID